MSNTQAEQKDFSVGQIGPDWLWKAELPVRQRSLKTARNVRLKVSGAAEVRPGSTRVAAADGDGWVIDVAIAGATYVLVFTAAKLAIFDKATRLQVGTTLTGLAWTSLYLPDIVISPYGAQVFVFHPSMPTQVVTRAAAGTWGVAAYAFSAGVGGRKRQPYYRFAAQGVTVTPSARTGSITLIASANEFATGHVGVRLRLQGREVEVTAYTSPTQVTATVIQELFPTVRLAVTSSAGYEVGEIVQGDVTGAKGEVVAISSGTAIDVLMQSFTPFEYVAAVGTTPATEKITGSLAKATLTANPTTISDAAVLDWDEAAVSPLRGYPATGTVHKNRLWMARFPNDPHGKMPFALMFSAQDDFTDFEAAEGDADAAFFFLGDAGAGTIQHLVSSEQMLILTTRRLYYVPESEQNPIRPTSFSVIQVGPDGASLCTPAGISEGVLFGSRGGGSIMAAFPTGDVRRSWRTVEMSRLTVGQIRTPRDMAYVSDADFDADNAENDVPSVRYAYVCNSDGGMAVLSYTQTEADAVPGWVPWDTAGEWRSVTAPDGEAWVLVNRDQEYQIEVIEAGRLLDGSVDITDSDLQGVASGEIITTPSGPIAAANRYRYAPYAFRTCALAIDGLYIGTVVLDGDGDFGVPALSGDIELGFPFTAEVEPWPVVDEQDRTARRRRKRIARALVRYTGIGMSVNGLVRPLYDAGEDTSAAPPVRDELYAFPCFGWSYEPTYTIAGAQAFPAFWTLLGMSAEYSG